MLKIVPRIQMKRDKYPWMGKYQDFEYKYHIFPIIINKLWRLFGLLSWSPTNHICERNWKQELDTEALSLIFSFYTLQTK